VSKIVAPAGSGRARPRGRTVALLTVLLTLAGRLTPAPSSTPAIAIDPAPLYALAATLAADDFAGRGPGTDGLERAAELLASRLAECGVAPAGEDGGFFAPFEAAAPARLGAANLLSLRDADGWHTLRVWDDWTPHGASASASVTAPLAYVAHEALRNGGPADAPLLEDRIALVRDPGPRGGALALHELATAARARGARGLIAIRDDGQPATARRRLPGYGWTVADAGLPIAVVERAAIVAVASGLPASPPARPFEVPGIEVDLRTGVVRTPITMRNVVGRVAGTGREGTIVLGAHYDHLGGSGESSPPGDGEPRLHPGADDNASGTAVAVAVACALAARPAPRTMVVALFAGEEIGLLGSTAYVADPPVPLAETVAMVNLDMVGRLRRERLIAFGTRTAVELGPIVRDVAEVTGLRIVPDHDASRPSDHTPFLAAGRPILHFWTGLHDDYHRPSDRPERLNAAGMAEVATAVFETVWRLATGPVAPAVTPLPRTPPGRPADRRP
jgi:hypothetical protein